METSEEAILQSWCMKELFYWQNQRPSFERISEEFRRRHASHPMQFLYHIRDGTVSISEKAPATPDRVPVWRPPLYLKFLRDVVAHYCPELKTDILIDVGDGGLTQESVPIFAFQKPAGGNAVLLPDVDFLENDFYELQRDFFDQTDYDKKSCSAVFVGSTTGGKPTRDVIIQQKLPRLKSALFFKNNPLVDFRLPVITRNTSDEARTALQELGFGKGDRLSYEDQFRHKFIISLDGFGATCSRLPIVLRSNSVLLKYDSPHLLYYFSAMLPWLHYIPISDDNDVCRIIQIENDHPGSFACIAKQGKDFAERFLVRSRAMEYTAMLLRMYADCLVGGEKRLTVTGHGQQTFSASDMIADDWGESSDISPTIEILAHLSFRGDVAFRAREWAGAEQRDVYVEGFALQLADGMRASDIEYRAVIADALLTPICYSGDFCGSRGNKSRILAFAIRTVGELARHYECQYAAFFADGSRTGPVRQGAPCQSTGDAALKALRVLLVPSVSHAVTPPEPVILFGEMASRVQSEGAVDELFTKI